MLKVKYYDHPPLHIEDLGPEVEEFDQSTQIIGDEAWL